MTNVRAIMQEQFDAACEELKLVIKKYEHTNYNVNDCIEIVLKELHLYPAWHCMKLRRELRRMGYVAVASYNK